MAHREGLVTLSVILSALKTNHEMFENLNAIACVPHCTESPQEQTQ